MSNDERGWLRRFFSGAWRVITVLRTSLANLVFLLLLVVLVVMVLDRDKPPPIPDRAALILDPVGRVVEQGMPENPLAALLDESGFEPETPLQDLIDAIDYAAKDARIDTVVMPMDGMRGTGISKGREIGAALTRFRAEGKTVIATADWLDQSSYLLASYADQIWLSPSGDLLLQGFGLYRNYYRDALDRFGIDFHVFRGGELKDAAEPLVSNTMSDASKEANRIWLQDLWQSYTEGVGARRELPPGAVDNYVNNMERIIAQYDGDGAMAARQYGLVDELKTRQEIELALRERLGRADGPLSYPAVNFRNYLASRRAGLAALQASDQVGILVAQGMILPGQLSPGLIGADGLADLIKQARDDERVRAVVLRIDTPGGVMFAGDVIRSALQDLQDSGKPLVVSMGAMAASGGYQIAAAADEIWAHETTLTGSIGVVAQIPSFHRALDQIGVHSDGIGTTDVAGGLDLSRPLSPVLRRRFELTVQHSYDRFLQLVAEGREMTTEQVVRAAEGRVWTGRQAQDLGLVDRVGGLSDAVRSAAALAGLEDYEWRWIEPPLNLGAQLLSAIPFGMRTWVADLLVSRGDVLDEFNLWVRRQKHTLANVKSGVVYSLCELCPIPGW